MAIQVFDVSAHLSDEETIRAYLNAGKRSINRVRRDKVCFQEAEAGEQFHGNSAS